MSEKKYYLYEHWRADKNVCFYVGIGIGRRPRVMYGRNEYHLRVQAKLRTLGYEVEVRIIYSDLSREEAISKEIERIAYWRAIGIELCNLTAGGDGTLDPSERTRELMRQRKLGRKLSDEHKEKITQASRRNASDPNYRQKLSVANKIAQGTPEAKERASKHFKTLVRTAEHRAKIAASKIGVKLSPAHAEKARNASLGRKQPQDEIERRRISLKKTWAEKKARQRAELGKKQIPLTKEWDQFVDFVTKSRPN